ncbi:MAG: hypothetical protein P8Y94_13715 [Acidobacteriota bacterium]
MDDEDVCEPASAAAPRAAIWWTSVADFAEGEGSTSVGLGTAAAGGAVGSVAAGVSGVTVRG